MKDLEEFEHRNFTHDEDENDNINTINNFKNIKTTMSRNSFYNSGNNNNLMRNSQQKYMPDHIASKLVDNILNDKFV